MRGHSLILCALLLLLGCSGGGGGGAIDIGEDFGGSNAGVGEPVSGDTTEGSSTSREITLPIDYFQIPCGEVIQTGPDEITIQISPSDLENCSEDSSFYFPFSLMATAYAQEVKELIRIRLRCQYPIRIEGRKIIIQVPPGISTESPTFEGPSFAVEGTEYIISLETIQPKELRQLLRQQLLAGLKEKEPSKAPPVEEEAPSEPPLEKVGAPPVKYFVTDPCTAGTQLGFCEPSCAEGYQCVVASREGCWECRKASDSEIILEGLHGSKIIIEKIKSPTGDNFPWFRERIIMPNGNLIQDQIYRKKELCVGESWSWTEKRTYKYYEVQFDNEKMDVVYVEEEPFYEGRYMTYSTRFTMTSKKVGKYIPLRVTHLFGEKHYPSWPAIFDVVDCRSPGSDRSLVEPAWPSFATDEFYEGPFPACAKKDGTMRKLESGIGTLLEGAEGHYTLALVEGGKWNRRFEGLFALGEIKSASPEVAEVRYHRLGGLVIEAKEAGHTQIRVMAGRLPDDFHPDKYQPGFKEQLIDVTVISEKAEQERECPRAAVVEGASEVGSCPVVKVEEPLFLNDLPENLDSPDQEMLAEKLVHLLEKGKLPAGCTEQTLKRQARKLVSAFYAWPASKGVASCVTCARNVAGNLLAVLKDEKISCIQIQNVMTHGWYGVIPPFSWLTDDVYHHEATAVGPACSPIKDDWLVFDTWTWHGQTYPFGRHQHHVEPLGVWRRTGITLKKVQTGQTFFLPPDDDISIESLKE